MVICHIINYIAPSYNIKFTDKKVTIKSGLLACASDPCVILLILSLNTNYKLL